MPKTVIALDFDGTYTAAPEFWNKVIEMAPENGVKIVICTFRDDRYDDNQSLLWLQQRVPVYFTRGVAKQWWMDQFGEHVDIWIDDRPEALLFNSTLTTEELSEWRNQESS